MMKDKWVSLARDFTSFSFFKDEPLSNDFKLHNISKFDGINDPKVDLRKYTTFMASIKLICFYGLH